jgi:hypothetical protein
MVSATAPMEPPPADQAAVSRRLSADTVAGKLCFQRLRVLSRPHGFELIVFE